MRNYSFHKGKTNSSIQNSVHCYAVFLSSLISIMPAHHLTFYQNQKLEKKLHSTQNKCTRFVYVMVQWTKLEQMNSEQ